MGIVSIVKKFANHVRAEWDKGIAEEREFYNEMTPDEKAEFNSVLIVNAAVPGAPVCYDGSHIRARLAAKKRAAALVAQ